MAQQASSIARFEAAVLPHLDAAHNLARWLMRDEHDAQDAVQEAYLRAWRFFDGLRGADSRPWLLTIVRNTCHTMMRQRHAHEATSLDEETMDVASDAPRPDAGLLRRADAQVVREAMESLPPEFREVLALHGLEGLSYKEVADVTGVPIGTVMSRLSRARGRLHRALSENVHEEA